LDAATWTCGVCDRCTIRGSYRALHLAAFIAVGKSGPSRSSKAALRSADRLALAGLLPEFGVFFPIFRWPTRISTALRPRARWRRSVKQELNVILLGAPRRSGAQKWFFDALRRREECRGRRRRYLSPGFGAVRQGENSIKARVPRRAAEDDDIEFALKSARSIPVELWTQKFLTDHVAVLEQNILRARPIRRVSAICVAGSRNTPPP
jgi:hypothetical protein